MMNAGKEEADTFRISGTRNAEENEEQQLVL